ncbi:MAG TPA: AAA domain-containing protein, partial [Solirubrobacter sp.]|nr:AAA domain-containing protein [Solirubrobacter sp.]
NAQLQNVLTTLTALREDARSLLGTFTPDAVAADLDALLIRSKTADGKLFKGKPRKAVVADLAPVTRAGATVDRASLTPTLEALLALRTRARELRHQAAALPGLALPGDWNPLAYDADELPRAQVAAIVAAARVAGAALAAAVASASTGPEDVERVTALRDAWAALIELLACSAESIDAWRGSRPVLSALRESLPAWTADAALVQLGRWVTVRGLLARLQAAGLDRFAGEILAGAVPLDEIETALRRGVADAVLAERLASPALAGFDGVARDRAIERFVSGADELRADMLTELPAKILSDRSISPDHLIGKAGQLSRELGRKRGGQKIRELFANFGPIIGELTPCLMMSPHSVARFLPADALEIDLVVFDEASQIRVAEAISAMGRARATVVVGDSQQMPPSNLMTTSASDDDAPQDDGIPSDMESVLSEAVESNLPRLWLSWHYRSRHESLIAFSNHQYYEGRLASFPRPPEDRSDLGVTWRRVDGTFERGRERVNREEAQAIVEEIRARLATDARASIGVVTFNVQQRDLIMDLLEECADPLVAAALAADEDPLFVKNLENVQGDERDAILFSLAFSPNPETGQLPLNFGPLIRAGGERRLNVAVTRAREHVVLFSSFDPHHIDLSRSSSVGLAHLRGYMEMAERRTGGPDVLRPAASRDLHHEDVVAAVRAAGLHVQRGVGLSEFKVDLAVAADPGGPWVAVFLDGPAYARRATVADRESLPHGVLVGAMGWSRVERIWLPDWVRDRDEAIARLVRAAHERPEPRVAPVVPPAPPPVPAPAAPRPELPRFSAAGEDLVGDRELLDAL